MKERIIGHLDMDAFFAAIEERDNPRFKGRPIVVGSDPEGGKGRGVVSTANYEARKYGIKSALPITTAWRFAEEAKKKGLPPVIFLSGHFGKYSAVSQEVMKIIKKYSPLVEQASVDEAYFDLSGAKNFAAAGKICKKIKEEIRKKERLTCSIGLAPNKLIAKIASDMQKPDGLTIVGADDPKTCAQLAEAFLEPLNIRKIPGIGPKTEILLNKLKIKTVADLKKLTKEKLKELLGKWGEELYEKARGLDNPPLIAEWEAKSVSKQTTFHKNQRDPNFITAELKSLAKDVVRRFEKDGFKTYKTIGITVRFADFETKTRAHTLPFPASGFATLYFEAIKMLMPFLDKRENPHGKTIRLVGVKIEKLEL